MIFKCVTVSEKQPLCDQLVDGVLTSSALTADLKVPVITNVFNKYECIF